MRQHPFPVEAHFEYSLVMTYAYPAEELNSLVPGCLELDRFEDAWGFVAVAMVQTRQLRPKGLPRALGNNFFLVGYRIFTRYRTVEGRRLRGLYILRSETDKLRMCLLGNCFTKYNYTRIEVEAEYRAGDQARIQSPTTGMDVRFDLREMAEPSLPQGSPFADWKHARLFAGPMPFTFSVEDDKIVIVEGRRSNWQPRAVEVLSEKVPALQTCCPGHPILASAFLTENIPYAWSRGRREPRKES